MAQGRDGGGTYDGPAPKSVLGIPDLFYAERLRKLVQDGRLESQGNLAYMRLSEVRLPQAKPV